MTYFPLENPTADYRDARQCRRPCSRTIMARIGSWQALRHRGTLKLWRKPEPWDSQRRG